MSLHRDAIAVDLYAGPGGWDEGARMAGLSTVGIEIEHDPCRTAVAAGHLRIQADVATYPTAPFAGRVAGLIGSPPCQAWSLAGRRLGELDRARVHALVDSYADGAHGGWRRQRWADPNSHHAAQPVRWIRDLLPPFVALEQVPPVLSLWQHIARVIRPWGYTTWCGVLNSADYGVPQTRRRAFLLASRIGVALPPEPTHAQHARDELFGSRCEWVSMAEALGWDGIDRPARTVCGDRSPRWSYGVGNSYSTGWTLNRPATTVQGDPRIGHPGHKDRKGGEAQFEQGAVRVTSVEAALLQSFPADYPWQGTKTSVFSQIGNAVPPLLAASVLRPLLNASALERAA